MDNNNVDLPGGSHYKDGPVINMFVGMPAHFIEVSSLMSRPSQQQPPVYLAK